MGLEEWFTRGGISTPSREGTMKNRDNDGYVSEEVANHFEIE